MAKRTKKARVKKPRSRVKRVVIAKGEVIEVAVPLDVIADVRPNPERRVVEIAAVPAKKSSSWWKFWD